MVAPNYIRHLNEYAVEMVKHPSYDWNLCPNIFIRTNNSIKLINITRRYASQLLDVGMYRSYLGGAFHLMKEGAIQ